MVEVGDFFFSGFSYLGLFFFIDWVRSFNFELFKNGWGVSEIDIFINLLFKKINIKFVGSISFVCG